MYSVKSHARFWRFAGHREISFPVTKSPVLPEYVRIKNGGVGERLKPAVLKFAGLCSHLIQINSLRYTVLHQNGVFWAVLAPFVQQNVQHAEFCTTGLLALPLSRIANSYNAKRTQTELAVVSPRQPK